jgi:hypothetical protein
MIDEDGGISEIIQADVTAEESCKNVVAKTVELWGAVHILVNIGMSKAVGKTIVCMHADLGPCSWRWWCYWRCDDDQPGCLGAGLQD